MGQQMQPPVGKAQDKQVGATVQFRPATVTAEYHRPAIRTEAGVPVQVDIGGQPQQFLFPHLPYIKVGPATLILGGEYQSAAIRGPAGRADSGQVGVAELADRLERL